MTHLAGIQRSQAGTKEDIHLRIKIMDRSYTEIEQYIIYDTGSFFADVGGFMGLLLGASLLSLYSELEALLRKFLCRSKKGVKVDIA